jgi:hypothetical protein
MGGQVDLYAYTEICCMNVSGDVNVKASLVMLACGCCQRRHVAMTRNGRSQSQLLLRACNDVK